MPAISVIMPVYNSEKYLLTAIRSVLNQTFTDFELLLIDDGSSDGSGEICDTAAKNDPRVRVVHQENGGICKARNCGLNLAAGEYVAFIDNDDEYQNNLLQENYELACQYGRADLVKYGYHVTETFAGRAAEERNTSSSRLIIMDQSTLSENYMEVKQSGFFNMIWNALYRREYLDINHLRFDEKIKFGYEDWVFNYSIYPLAERVVINPAVYYVHYQRTGFSTSKKFYINRPYGCISAAKEEKKLFTLLGLDDIFPHRWGELLIKYLIEILVLFEYPDCSMKLSEKTDFLDKMKQNIPFSDVLSREDVKWLAKTSRTKNLVRFLFYKNHYKMLLFFSKVYYYYLNLKKKR